MIITIQIQDQQDYQWLKPFLETLKNTSAKIQIKGDVSEEESVKKKKGSFLKFLEGKSIIANKVEIPNRDKRNAR